MSIFQKLDSNFPKIAKVFLLIAIVDIIWSCWMYATCYSDWFDFCALFLSFFLIPSIGVTVAFLLLWWMARKRESAIFSRIALAIGFLSVLMFLLMAWEQTAEWYSKITREIADKEIHQELAAFNITLASIEPLPSPDGDTIVPPYYWRMVFQIENAHALAYDLGYVHADYGAAGHLYGMFVDIKPIQVQDISLFKIILPSSGGGMNVCPTSHDCAFMPPGSYEATALLYPSGWRVRDNHFCIVEGGMRNWRPKPGLDSKGKPIEDRRPPEHPGELRWDSTIETQKASSGASAFRPIKGTMQMPELPQEWEDIMLKKAQSIPICDDQINELLP